MLGVSTVPSSMFGAALRPSVPAGAELSPRWDNGKSVDGLKQGLRDVIPKDVDETVEDGVLTKQQANRFRRSSAMRLTSSSKAGADRLAQPVVPCDVKKPSRSRVPDVRTVSYSRRCPPMS